jgi:tetratricopeptide (TPR) repeat protein
LLNLLLLLLILFPIAGVILLWRMRREMVSEVVNEVEGRLSDELKAEVSRELQGELTPGRSNPALSGQNPAQLKDMVSMALSVQNVMSNARHSIENSMQLQERLDSRLKEVMTMQMRQGEELAAAEKHAEAIAAFDQAIEVDGDSPQPYCAKAKVLVKLQRLEEALATYAKAAEVAPDSPQAWYGIARCYALVQHQEPAIENLKKAIALQPELKAQAQSDPDFANLREHEGFQTAVVG